MANDPIAASKKQPIAQGFVAILAQMAGAQQGRTGETKVNEQKALELARSARVIWQAAQTVWGED